ncbi:hypothetical protein Tsubulata_023319 [Turnera subulata]|uniref:Helicase associated domain-containing protein n=1 Tax=Turnera subulata TaxID=218843 RepID=A0A9Q0J8T2_9ROSI|nr:hypothetical protein Tsubulata_023319 [Turnera subulata]
MEEAFKIKDKMEKEAISPSIELYNSLISGLFKSKKLSEVMKLLGEIYTLGVAPNVVTYEAVIAGWCDEGRLDKAFSAYFEMIEKGFAPNLIICSKIVSCLYRLRRIDEANMLLQKMVDFDLVLDQECFNRLQSTDCQKIVETLDETSESFSLPNNVAYNIAIAGLCKSGKVDSARRLFSDLLLRGFSPDNFTYCTLIHGFSASGNVNEAFNIRDEMVKRNLVPSIITYNALINGLCKSGNLQRAQNLFNKLRMKGLTPNVVTYNILIDGFCRCGNTSEALELKDKMLNEGIPPSIVTYTSLINGFCKQGEVEGSTKLLDEMTKSSANQNLVTFTKLVEGYIKGGDTKSMSKLHNMMHITWPSAGDNSRKQLESELSIAKELLDAYVTSAAVGFLAGFSVLSFSASGVEFRWSVQRSGTSDSKTACLTGASGSTGFSNSLLKLLVRVFTPPPPNCRRFIVSTNIAETSLTIDGVVYVIDCDYVKQRPYNPSTGMYSLDVVQISDVLYLKSLDLPDIDILKFDFLDPPSYESLQDALKQLYIINAIDDNGSMSSIGRTMAGTGFHPIQIC